MSKAAEEGQLPKFLAVHHKKYNTPIAALLVQVLIELSFQLLINSADPESLYAAVADPDYNRVCVCHHVVAEGHFRCSTAKNSTDKNGS